MNPVKRSTERRKGPNAFPVRKEVSLEQLFAELDGALTMIEEVELPEVYSRLREIRRACGAVWKLSFRLQKRLGFFKHTVKVSQ